MGSGEGVQDGAIVREVGEPMLIEMRAPHFGVNAFDIGILDGISLTNEC